jgi:hypothetical protein
MLTWCHTVVHVAFRQQCNVTDVLFGSCAGLEDVKWLVVTANEGRIVQQLPNYGDERNKGWCVFCGGPMETRDHAPSRVFLDEPYPDNLPVLASCDTCNNSFSLDEEYLACLIECARTGSVKEAGSTRPKIAKILARKPALEARLAAARCETGDGIIWKPEDERVHNVVVKLARAHVAYEQNEPQLDDRTSVSIIPLCAMTDEARNEFEAASNTGLWPEVGSRAMHRILVEAEGDYPWIEVQPGRYRYLVACGPLLVRIVIAEYLAAEVVWD